MQFLESYKSVTLQSMADSFGVSIDFMDKELSDFIVAGRLPAKIDKVAGIIETTRCVKALRDSYKVADSASRCLERCPCMHHGTPPNCSV